MEQVIPLSVLIRQNQHIEILKEKEKELLGLLNSLYDINIDYRNEIALLERQVEKLKKQIQPP